jgi:hypothetical protein
MWLGCPQQVSHGSRVLGYNYAMYFLEDFCQTSLSECGGLAVLAITTP